ncbi:SSH [Acanthosepion pharaonis]|uniref:protein-serine/threonine phosphatase n=1 Tax=Acanthosepion pharaonis TaxID=158019 RepID=A0A812DD37_ACAPH|nr:SSH [Sepia pharaonis]
MSTCKKLTRWQTTKQPSSFHPLFAQVDKGGCGELQREPLPKATHFSENYFTVKGAALILPQSDCSQRSSRNNGGDIQQHLQQMFYLLRPEDTIKVAVKLESCYQDRKIWRYMAVVCCNGNQDTEESIILGLDLKEKEATIGLVLAIWANTKITLDGDGGFSVNSEGADYLFKPVSVQAMWSALQSLHKVINTANLNNYIPKGLTHTWVEFYKAKINSDVSCIKEWNLMEDIESYAADSPYSSEKQELETDGMKNRISIKLRELMMSMDLEETTSKELRNSLEASLNMSLIEYKSYIDQEMMRILGQMDAPSKIFPYLYLGSEWNASNYDELEENGVKYILNVSREIDNFFPEKYHYMNVREFDNEQSDLMKHWKRTYEFIKKVKENNGKVLVHCKMGISRSASTVIAFKMKEDGCSFQEAFNFVKNKRNVIRPNKAFIAQLEEYHGILTASRKRYLFGSKSSSEEVDMENGSGLCQLGNEARSLSSITYYEQKDDPRFLPIDDDNSFALDYTDIFSDKDDHVDILEPSQPRVRAYTYDNSSSLPSKFKADDSWITLPQSVASATILQAKKQDQGLKNDTNEKLEPCGLVATASVTNEMKSATTTAAPTKPVASTASPQLSRKEELSHMLPSAPYTKTPGVSSTTEMRHLDMTDGSLKTPASTSKMSGDGSKISASSVSVTVSSDNKETVEEGKIQAMVPYECGQNNNNNNNNNNNDEAVSECMPTRFAKDDIPWNPGNVRKQREKMEEQIKSGTKDETVTEDDGAAWEALKNDKEMPISDYHSQPEQVQAPSASFSVMHSSPQKLKTSHSFSSFPVSGDEAQNTPAGGGSVCDAATVAERPQSVCFMPSGKDMSATLAGTQKDSLVSVQEPLFDSMLPSVYKMEDIDLPAGIVRRTTKELEEKHRSCDHELTTVGLSHEDKKPQPVQRSSSLGSERDRPRLERTKRRKTCTPILSPGNFESSEFPFYDHSASLDCADLDPDVGQDSKLHPPLCSAASMEDHLLSSYTEDSQVKDIMVYRYGAEQVEITGGSVRRRMKGERFLAGGIEFHYYIFSFLSFFLSCYFFTSVLQCPTWYVPFHSYSSITSFSLFTSLHLLHFFLFLFSFLVLFSSFSFFCFHFLFTFSSSPFLHRFDKDTEDVACLSESSKQGTLNSVLGHATSSKTTAPPSTPPITTITTVSTANVTMTTASKSSTCVSPKNTARISAAVTTTTPSSTVQMTPKTLRKQEELKGACSKSVAQKTVKDSDKDYESTLSKAASVTMPSKIEKEKVSKDQVPTVSVNMSSVLSSSEEPSILSGCVTKMTQQIEQMSKEVPNHANAVKDPASSKSHLFQLAAISSALDSPFSCHLSASGTVQENESFAKESECSAVASKDLRLKKPHRVDESTAVPFEFEKTQLLKAKSLDESILALPLEVTDIAHSDGKIVRHLVGKFDPNLVKELDNDAVPAKLRDDSMSAVSSTGDGLQPKMSEVVSQSTLGSPFYASPSKTVPPVETKSVPPCSSSQVLPNTFGAINSPRSSTKNLSSIGKSKPLVSTSLVSTSHNLTHSPAATSFSVTSSITTTAAVASVAMTTTSITTATSSTATTTITTATTTANISAATTKSATQTGPVNTQLTNVQSVQWWPQNMQCRTGLTEQAPCPNLTPTTSTSVTSTSASPAATHNVPISAAAAAAATTSSSTSLTWRAPFMSDSRAFLQEGRKCSRLPRSLSLSVLDFLSLCLSVFSTASLSVFSTASLSVSQCSLLPVSQCSRLPLSLSLSVLYCLSLSVLDCLSLCLSVLDCPLSLSLSVLDCLSLCLSVFSTASLSVSLSVFSTSSLSVSQCSRLPLSLSLSVLDCLSLCLSVFSTASLSVSQCSLSLTASLSVSQCSRLPLSLSLSVLDCLSLCLSVFSTASLSVSQCSRLPLSLSLSVLDCLSLCLSVFSTASLSVSLTLSLPPTGLKSFPSSYFLPALSSFPSFLPSALFLPSCPRLFSFLPALGSFPSSLPSAPFLPPCPRLLSFLPVLGSFPSSLSSAPFLPPCPRLLSFLPVLGSFPSSLSSAPFLPPCPRLLSFLPVLGSFPSSLSSALFLHPTSFLSLALFLSSLSLAFFIHPTSFLALALFLLSISFSILFSII